MQFQNKEDVKDFIEFLQMKGRPIPKDVEEELRRFEAMEQITEEEHIFGTMKANNPFMTEEKEAVVRKMADKLLETGEEAKKPCLLLGKVQCGKTDTFLSIMGLCFDRGIDIAVVMTKGTNTLTQQTIQRLNKDFRFFKDKHTYGQKVVISVWDILDLYKRGGLSDYQLNDPANKFIIVVKKENTNLKDLNELFECNELMRSKKVLVCDDEADFASRNYYQRKGKIDLMRIAEHIENFIKLPHFCRYLQITATPYSLYLQPDGTVQLREGDEASPWLPRYTGLVPIHAKYIGGKQYYEDSQDEKSMYSCLFQSVDPQCMEILSNRNEWYLDSNVHSANLGSLNYAVVSYLFAAAIRTIQEKKKSNERYFSSCLIHCEIAKHNHQWQAEIITGIIESIKHAFLHKGNSDLHILDLESDAYESFRHSNQLGNKEGLIDEKFPSFGEVEAEVKRILQYNDYTINVVNSEEPGRVATMLNDKGQLRLEQSLNFFIGGSILDRGITIDNMLCFFYGRDPKKFQMDTVLQHARMYGAREKADMACTRFFTTDEIYDVLKTMNEFDEYLYQYLKANTGTVQTDDFTSIVIGYDKRVKPTAQNKYTPANTKVLKPGQRILPIGFQTGEAETIGNTIKKIDKLIASCEGFKDVTEDNPFFMMDYATAAEIVKLASSTLLYGEEYENMERQWDQNEMLTALDHCTFDTDGLIYCLYRKNRNASRERDHSRQNKTKWIDAPDDGRTDLPMSREKAIDRPVLMLLRQNGDVAQGWRGTPFYWPLLLLPQNMQSGIFTVNGNKKLKATKKQIKLDSIKDYPAEQILGLTIKKEFFFDILAGVKEQEYRVIKPTTATLYLKRDNQGHFMLIDKADLKKHYNLSASIDGKFPFVVREYACLHLRCSRDNSGSQALVKLKANPSHELLYEQYDQNDVIYNDRNEGYDAINQSEGVWTIAYNIDKVLEYKLTSQDEESYNGYLEELKM